MSERAIYSERCRQQNACVKETFPCLWQYLRKHMYWTPKGLAGRGEPTGIAVAVLLGGEVWVGCAKCNVKLEKFDREIGFRKAYERALQDFNEQAISIPPDSMVKLCESLRERATRFFTKQK